MIWRKGNPHTFRNSSQRGSRIMGVESATVGMQQWKRKSPSLLSGSCKNGERRLREPNLIRRVEGDQRLPEKHTIYAEIETRKGIWSNILIRGNIMWEGTGWACLGQATDSSHSSIAPSHHNTKYNQICGGRKEIGRGKNTKEVYRVKLRLSFLEKQK